MFSRIRGASSGVSAKWLQVLLDQLGAGWQDRKVRTDPTRPPQQSGGGRVDRVPPRREERDVRPLGDGGSDLVAGLQDQGLQAPFDQVRGGGQPNRAGADDHDG